MAGVGGRRKKGERGASRVRVDSESFPYGRGWKLKSQRFQAELKMSLLGIRSRRPGD